MIIVVSGIFLQYLYFFKVDPDDLALMRKYHLKFKKSEESEAFRNNLRYLDKVLRKGTMIIQHCVHALQSVQQN